MTKLFFKVAALTAFVAIFGLTAFSQVGVLIWAQRGLAAVLVRIQLKVPFRTCGAKTMRCLVALSGNLYSS
jgi:hypothetical protein